MFSFIYMSYIFIAEVYKLFHDVVLEKNLSISGLRGLVYILSDFVLILAKL